MFFAYKISNNIAIFSNKLSPLFQKLEDKLNINYKKYEKGHMFTRVLTAFGKSIFQVDKTD